MSSTFNQRIGTFFYLVGLALLLIFIGSILSKDIHVIYLLLAFLAILAGIRLRRDRPVTEGGRFGTFRRVKERNRQRQVERMQKKHDSRSSPSGRRRQEPKSGNEENQDENEKRE
jgi:hypothetical protein